ncbi:MAG: PH domain-containing protein [Nitratireductor sp.]|nr:PH domain-containing protein [Nitratireductor sp.]MCB1457916.1 PH domain-containing protein [Nitratireductor sp.]
MSGHHHSETGGPEHDFEPVPGLPAELPDGEHVIWQGAPVASAVSARFLKTRWIAGYFAVLVAWTLVTGFYDGRTLGSILFSASAVTIMGTIVIALLEAFAWGVHKTTLYTITNRRIVMRIGVALSVTYNLPFSQIISADLRADRNGNGDIAFVLAPGARLSLMVFWPHARGWRKGRMIPQMIGLDKAADVGRLLAVELQAHGQASAVAAARDDGAQSVRETVVMAAE